MKAGEGGGEGGKILRWSGGLTHGLKQAVSAARGFDAGAADIEG